MIGGFGLLPLESAVKQIVRSENSNTSCLSVRWGAAVRVDSTSYAPVSLGVCFLLGFGCLAGGFLMEQLKPDCSKPPTSPRDRPFGADWAISLVSTTKCCMDAFFEEVAPQPQCLHHLLRPPNSVEKNSGWDSCPSTSEFASLQELTGAFTMAKTTDPLFDEAIKNRTPFHMNADGQLEVVPPIPSVTPDVNALRIRKLKTEGYVEKNGTWIYRKTQGEF
jgi:hypothetical protein